MQTFKRSTVAAGLGLAFLVAGAGAGHASVAAPATHPTVITECNADPNYDPSQDPKKCVYEHPLPDPTYGYPEGWQHHRPK